MSETHSLLSVRHRHATAPVNPVLQRAQSRRAKAIFCASSSDRRLASAHWPLPAPPANLAKVKSIVGADMGPTHRNRILSTRPRLLLSARLHANMDCGVRDRLATGALFISFSRRGTNSLRVLFSRLLALPTWQRGGRTEATAAPAPQHLMTQEATFAQCVMLEVAERTRPRRIGRVS